jgi:RNA polymerase sigma-70 factor (ECF subfamily)
MGDSHGPQSSPPPLIRENHRPSGESDAWFEGEILSILPDLYGTAVRLTRNSADAEDLVAETVAKAWTHLSHLSDRARFRGWIFRILTTTFLSDCRARRRQPVQEAFPEEGTAFSLFERLHQPYLLWWGNPEQEFLNTLLREDLERAVDALPEVFRVVVVLAEMHGFSYQEIADTLHVPLGTVRSRLARGRSLLQRALWEHAKDAGLTSSKPEPTPAP